MALLPYVETKAPEKTREILNRGKVKMNVARMIANSNAAFYPFSMLGNSLLTRSKLDAKLREIAILRTAKVSKSVYEWTQHVPIAKHVGVTDAQIAAMDNPEGASLLQRPRKAGHQVHRRGRTQREGQPGYGRAAKKHMGATEIVELTMSIGFWGMVARVLETTEVDLEDFAGKVNLLTSDFARR